MNNISDRIARKEYLPMSEEDQQEFVEAFGQREVKEDSLVKEFAIGMFSGALGGLPVACLGQGTPSISDTGGKIRNAQVVSSLSLNDGLSAFLVKYRHGNNPNQPRHDPGWFTYMTGAVLTGLGVLLSGTPAGPILLGVGAGLIGNGISIAGEAKAAQPRNPRN